MKPQEKKIAWLPADDAEHPYEALVEGKTWQIRIGDFPTEPMYSLLIDGLDVATFDEWPVAWSKPAPRETQVRYYLVNDRPVKFVPTHDGGMDVLALNMRTGEFQREMEYLSKVTDPFADVDTVKENEFAERVAEVRAGLS